MTMLQQKLQDELDKFVELNEQFNVKQPDLRDAIILSQKADWSNGLRAKSSQNKEAKRLYKDALDIWSKANKIREKIIAMVGNPTQPFIYEFEAKSGEEYKLTVKVGDFKNAHPLAQLGKPHSKGNMSLFNTIVKLKRMGS